VGQTRHGMRLTGRYTASRIAEVAQLVEHRSEKPGVDSSILSLGTTILNIKLLPPRTAGAALPTTKTAVAEPQRHSPATQRWSRRDGSRWAGRHRQRRTREIEIRKAEREPPSGRDALQAFGPTGRDTFDQSILNWRE